MHIYRCELTLLEATFFSSREVSATYQTEPLLGNIALAYAFGFCQAPYFNDGTIHYHAHLAALNEQGLYVTPGTIVGQPRFSLGQFNAQADAYWYALRQQRHRHPARWRLDREGRPGMVHPLAGWPAAEVGPRTGRSMAASASWLSATAPWPTCSAGSRGASPATCGWASS